MSDSKWVINNKVKIWTESFGEKANPAVLLIVGAGAISTFYSDDFCQKIASAGLFVIRYDQRDYGKSTHFKQISLEDLSDIRTLEKKLPYRLEHLVEDARIILDTYGILKAHIAGHSMGGVVVQLFAVIHPDRLLSFTSISVGPASQRFELEPVSEEIMEVLLSNQPTGKLENDLDGWLTSFKLLNGKMEFDETKARKYVEEIYKKPFSMNNFPMENFHWENKLPQSSPGKKC